MARFIRLNWEKPAGLSSTVLPARNHTTLQPDSTQISAFLMPMDAQRLPREHDHCHHYGKKNNWFHTRFRDKPSNSSKYVQTSAAKPPVRRAVTLTDSWAIWFCRSTNRCRFCRRRSRPRQLYQHGAGTTARTRRPQLTCSRCHNLRDVIFQRDLLTMQPSDVLPPVCSTPGQQNLRTGYGGGAGAAALPVKLTEVMPVG